MKGLTNKYFFLIWSLRKVLLSIFLFFLIFHQVLTTFKHLSLWFSLVTNLVSFLYSIVISLTSNNCQPNWRPWSRIDFSDCLWAHHLISPTWYCHIINRSLIYFMNRIKSLNTLRSRGIAISLFLNWFSFWWGWG